MPADNLIPTLPTETFPAELPSTQSPTPTSEAAPAPVLPTPTIPTENQISDPMPVTEPTPKSSPTVEIPSENISTSTPSAISASESETANNPASIPINPPSIFNLKSLLNKAIATIKNRKRNKLEKIIKVVQEKGSITNDQVEKLLHVSDATATRYLSALVKQGRLRQVNSGRYSKYRSI